LFTIYEAVVKMSYIMDAKAFNKPQVSAHDEQLSGLVERVTYHSEESGFCVLRIKANRYSDQVTVIGTLPQVRAGEWIDAQGRWIVSRDYGSQFKADVLKTTSPDTPEGIEKYLASGLIKGIGPGFASRLVNRFGKKVLDNIESNPSRLLEVDGIGKQRYEKITSAWQEQRIIRQIMVFLHSHDVSTSRAFRIYKQYGQESIQQVSRDPYSLAREIRGIGFKSADKIAASLGVEKESPLRAQAGVEYILGELTNQGHCGCQRSRLVKSAVEILQIPPETV
jgi:exodeoxyribonuclease V alpha subunit